MLFKTTIKLFDSKVDIIVDATSKAVSSYFGCDALFVPSGVRLGWACLQTSYW